LEDPGLDGNIILKWILRELDESCRPNPAGSELGSVSGCFDQDNEIFDPIKFGEFD
jgi:hypothetical protein